MKKWTIAALAAAAAFSLAAAPKVTVTTDKSMPIYRCGESAAFTVSATDGDRKVEQGKMTLRLTLGNGKVLSTTPIDLAKENPVTVKATLDQPGFLYAVASEFVDLEKPRAYPAAGAAFEPEKIQMGFELPADFKEFWESGRKQLAGDTVHLTKLEGAKYVNDKITCYRVVVDVLHGEKLYGYLAVPNGKGPFPALVTVPGAGPGAVGPLMAWAEQGVIALVMNVHKFPGSQNAAEQRKMYADYNKKLGYSYSNHCSDDRDKYHFRNVILGVDRAISYVAAMPQWNRKQFVIDGSSQGGAMALILSGFNPHLTAAAANVPAMCDHGGYRFDRQPGWPNLVKGNAKKAEVAAYYDAANFAKFITAPVLTSCGYIDTTCSPSSVYAAYNQIKSPKKLIDMPLARHEIPKLWKDYQGPWVRGQLGLGKVLPPTR